MEQCNEKPSTEKSDDSEEPQEQEERGSRWRGALDSARRGIQRSGEVIVDATADATDVTVRGIRRSGEAIADASLRSVTESTSRGIQRSSEVVADATTDAASATKRGAIRTGEVLSGADIRRFDEFTEAVTRVAVGLHHDQADVKERVARLEQEAAEIRRFQTELAERLESIERMFAAQHDEDNKGVKDSDT